MKRFFIPILLLLVIMCWAEDPGFDLGDFVIEGEGKILPDSLNEANLGDSLSTLGILDALAYEGKPLTVKMATRSKRKEISNSAIQLLGGNVVFGSFNLISINDTVSWKNFGFDGNYVSSKKDWNRTFIEFDWMPTLLNHNIEMSPHYFKVNSLLGDTKLDGIDFNLQPAEERVHFINDYSLSVGLNNFEQNVQDAVDFDVKTTIKFNYRHIAGESSLQYVKQTPSGYVKLFSKVPGIPILRDIGVWLAADSLHIYPTLAFSGNYSLTDKTELFIEQNPQLSAISRFQEMIDNPYQKIIATKLQNKKIINLKAGLLVNSFMKLKLVSHSMWEKDFQYFNYTAGTLLTSKRKDLFTQKFGVEIGNSWRNTQIKNETYFILRNKEIPYMGNIKSTTDLTLTISNFIIGTDLSIEIGREDEAEKEFDSIVSLNSHIQYQMLKNLFILIKGCNLLNSDWQKYPGLPENQFEFQAGLRWHY